MNQLHVNKRFRKTCIVWLENAELPPGYDYDQRSIFVEALNEFADENFDAHWAHSLNTDNAPTREQLYLLIFAITNQLADYRLESLVLETRYLYARCALNQSMIADGFDDAWRNYLPYCIGEPPTWDYHREKIHLLLTYQNQSFAIEERYFNDQKSLEISMSDDGFNPHGRWTP